MESLLQNRKESLTGKLVKTYVEDFFRTGEISQDFIELIKHNFYAKYVAYDPAGKTIEIGVNETNDTSSIYPDIKVYNYSLEETNWLDGSFRKNAFDIEYYERLLEKRKHKI